MSDIIRQRYDAYYFGAVSTLSPQNLERLIGQFNAAAGSDAGAALGGRRSVAITTLDGIGSVVVKHYRRGGLLAHLNKKTYLRTGKPRCQLEFEQMAYARAIGVNAPEPVAYAYRGRVFYHGWLVTREIEGQQSLAVLSTQDPDRAEAAIQALAGQVATLVEHQILHADFHPGNVLVDRDNQVFIIDFDKAGQFAGGRDKLKERYYQRWQRAVHKHGLPEMLVEMLRSLI